MALPEVIADKTRASKMSRYFTFHVCRLPPKITKETFSKQNILTMTFNWGHKLTLGFIAFAGMIIYMVVQSMNTRYELVSNEYYKDELQYQQVIDGASRANQLSSRAIVTQQNDELVIQLPAEMQQKTITGSLWLYNATDSKKDKKLALQVNDRATQTVDSRLLMPGNYTAKLSWTSNGETYYSEVPVTIH